MDNTNKHLQDILTAIEEYMYMTVCLLIYYGALSSIISLS